MNAILTGSSRITVSLSTVAAQSAPLPRGSYDVWSDVDCYIKTGQSADDVTTGTGYLLYGGNMVTVDIDDAIRFGGIVSASTGTLNIHRVG